MSTFKLDLCQKIWGSLPKTVMIPEKQCYLHIWSASNLRKCNKPSMVKQMSCMWLNLRNMLQAFYYVWVVTWCPIERSRKLGYFQKYCCMGCTTWKQCLLHKINRHNENWVTLFHWHNQLAICDLIRPGNVREFFATIVRVCEECDQKKSFLANYIGRAFKFYYKGITF